MRYLVIVVMLFSVNIAHASFTPLSGTFSNAEQGKAGLSFNLIVSVNENGQQFYFQCVKGEQAGFGVIKTLENPKIEVVLDNIDPDLSLCGVENIEIELDYEEALITINGNRSNINRSAIYVPIVD